MHQEYRALAVFVRRIQRGLTLRRLLQAGISLLSLLLVLLLFGVGVRMLLPFVPIVAPVASAVAGVVLLCAAVFILLPALRRVTRRQALTSIEQTYPELHDDLTNALELDPTRLEQANPHGVALDLVRVLHQQTAHQVRRFNARTVVRRYPLYGLSWCAMFLLSVALVAVMQPGLLGDALWVMLHPTRYLPARDIHIALTPTRVTIAHGSSLEVLAHASGRIPRSMSIQVTREGQADKRYPMEVLEPGTFRYVFLKPQTSFAFQAQAGGFASPQGHVQVVPAPAVGQLTLRYLFPDYTGLPPRIQEGGGDIQALPGTQVQLTMQANVPLRKGRLRFENGHELPLSIAEQSLRGEILVMEEGAYRIEVEDTHGLTNPQPPRYTVQLLSDLAPTVQLQQPEDGMEVDETTVLDIRYEAEDDFGLQDAALVYFGADAVEQRISLHRGRFAHRQVENRFSWDMHQWPLPDGDTVQFYIEVYDNDTILGPKRGVSQTLTLHVRDREQEHQALEQLQDEMADTLLDLLADHLELAEQVSALRQSDGSTPPNQTALQQAQERQQQAMERAEQVNEQLQEALAKVQQDPYSTYETFADMQALQRNMAHLQDALLPQLRQNMQTLSPESTSPAQLGQTEQALEEVIQELERLASLAENVANAEKLNDLMHLSNKMMEQQNQLLSALDNLPQDFSGGEIPPDLQKMLDALNALMQDLANAIAQLPQSMPDEFLNQQLETLPLTDMMQQLDAIRQKLAEGDIEGAKQLAAELMKTLSSLVASMQNMLQQARGGSMNAMAQQLQESSDTLSQLVQRQEAIVQDTQGVDQEALRQLNQAQQRAFEVLQPQLERDLSELTKMAWDLSQRARPHAELGPSFQRAYQELLQHLQALQKSLEAHDLPQATQDLEAAQQQFAGMQRRAERAEAADALIPQRATQALERLQAMRRQLDSLPQERQAMLTPPQREQLGELGEQQGTVREDTENLQQAFDNLLPLMPFLPPEMGKNLREAVPFMQQAEGELAGRRSQQALPPEQDALERLRSAQNSLQQAMQQMAQRGQMMGMSMPMLRQAGRLPMPNMMPQPQVDEQQMGVAGASVRNFQLPDKEAYKVPRMFREDIMEALKEGYPARYKELIEQYYRNIVR
jgi:hypothetical protein